MPCFKNSSNESSASDEASQLELHLQRQLEEDVARIFDESIYTDLEVVCGKLKILTHSCILKARTDKFYHVLETILHVNIGRSAFDEIYSFISGCEFRRYLFEEFKCSSHNHQSSLISQGYYFLSLESLSEFLRFDMSLRLFHDKFLEQFDILYRFLASLHQSDTYTECNIIHQEEEILKYLKTNSFNVNGKEEGEEPEEFFTPKCISPYIDRSLKKSISSSPSTELTKEYYALVPIDGNLLEKELVEQDVLSTAFQSIIRSQGGDRDKINFQRNKPTSLALISSHLPKSAKHSNSCDILIKTNLKDDVLNEIVLGIEKKSNKTSSHNATNKHIVESNKPTDIGIKHLKSLHQDTEAEPVYSPDSLITDDPSSSSDYLSAAYTCSPGVVSVCNQQLNVGTNITKMENIFTSSDSGLENTGLLESLTSHKDVTLTDMSLTESTLHDLTTDDGSNSHDSVSSPLVEKKVPSAVKFDSSLDESKSQTSDHTGRQNDMNCNSSKEEKQRQNEEIVILESSSLSSETGSWESVFPPKVTTKDVCEKFLHKERQNSYPLKQKLIKKELSNDFEDHTQSLVQKSPFKSTSCFIDAASLADEEDETIRISRDVNEAALVQEPLVPDAMMPVPSQPVPCSTHKVDISPNDWSENDNEDSLEQLENKDPDSIQKDLSPTIFEMTPITEDSLCTNAFEQVQEKVSVEPNPVHTEESTLLNTAKDESMLSNTVFVSNTPHNSIMSLKASAFKQYESEESESDTTIVGRDCQSAVKNLQKYNESSPIISGGASVEDHLPNLGMYSGSPLVRRRIENTPIVSGAYVPPPEEEKQTKSPRPSCAPAWVVDMSSTPKCDEKSAIKKPLDKACDSLRNTSKNSNSLENCSKSRSSVDSDSSERSSHKFYIDLTNLPSPIPTTNLNESENTSEKKNMFSMYIDFGEKPTLKEIPARLSSLHTKKNSNETPKSTPRNQKPIIPNETPPPTLTKTIDITSTSIFEKFETLCEDPNMSISEIINLSERNRKQNKLRERVDSESGIVHENESRSYCGERSLHRSLRSTIHEESINDQDIEPFVRLSDLDKPVQKANPPIIKKSERIPDERMTRSIPDSNWCEQQNQASTSRSNEIISSFHSENALSLNRLFPHLRNEFSRSMPGSLSSRTRSPLRLGVCSSPGDVDDQTSDTSDMSSVQSSFCRSIIENSTTEETSQASSLIGNCQSRLGQDLLRMFLEEIAPDVIVEVSGRRIKAHKCILSSRCQYFAGILSGGWVESAGNVIALPPFSFNVVQFALCHIYSGVSTIPDSISIVELATLADMLGLEGLKEAIMFTLKAKYCHHFHKPCAVCKAGVLECFPLCSVYGLDDLYRKCLKWIIKYFPWVWPTKAFATLPSELLEKCYHEIVINMTLENVIDTVYGCGFTVESLHHIRWGEIVARMCRRLVHAAAHFIAPKLMTVLRDVGSLPADPPPSAKQALDECMAAAIEWAPPDECCRAYALLSSVAREIRNHRFAKPDLITNGNQNNVPGQDNLLYVSAGSWLLQCEGALVRAAPRVCCTQAFIDLPSELRRRLRELGCITYGGQPPAPAQPQAPPSRKSRTHHYKSHKPHSATSVTRSLEIDQMRASFVPYSPMPTAVAPPEVLKNSHLQDSKKSNRPIPPKVRTTKAQEERAKFNMSKKNPSQERLNAKTTAKPLPFENAKPRYLEPKTSHESYKKMPNTKKLVSKISSSESSRNSSPIQARNFRTGRIKSRPVDEIKAKALSQDSLATSSRPRTAEPSTDSLSESQTSNKYATYTKSKHTPKVANSDKSGRYATTPSATTNGTKTKTKIPVYLNSLSKSHNSDNKSHGESSKKKSVSVTKTSTTTTATSSTSLPHRNKTLEKATSCSLMNATKSSQAKMVAKVVKESVRSKPAPKNKGSSKRAQRCTGDSEASPVPIMERSGTFLKDEPTFGDKTTDIDLDH